jgi:hypothetical protein
VLVVVLGPGLLFALNTAELAPDAMPVRKDKTLVLIVLCILCTVKFGTTVVDEITKGAVPVATVV